MLLYRGSNVEVRTPQLIEGQRPLDFGSGFYTTADGLKVLRFEAPDAAWLAFAAANLTEQETIARLLPQKLKGQAAFKTDRALEFLRRAEVVRL